MADTRPLGDLVLVYHQARTAHLERLQHAGVTLLYQSARYDFHAEAARDHDVRRVTPLEAFRLVYRNPPRIIEITEPTYYPGIRLAAGVTLAARLAARVRRAPRPRIVTYAIGNSDPRHDFRPANPRTALGFAVNHTLSLLVWRSCDRVAFGTAAASEEYRRVFASAPRGQSRALIPALPAPCGCGEPQALEGHLVFLGDLSPRKGFERTLQAWESLADPGLQLTIVGRGAGLAQARALAARDARVVVLEDPPRSEIHRVLRTAAALVLPSQRTPRWREQIGLPVLEALAHGCRVVTTDETGLAGWLRTHDHIVLPAAGGTQDLARAMHEAALHPRRATDVLADLPSRDGRQVAESWLIREETP